MRCRLNAAMNRSDSSFGASSLSSWSLDSEESLSKSSKVGEGGGDGDGGVGSLGGIIPCFLKASLLVKWSTLCEERGSQTHNSVSSFGLTAIV